MTMIDNELMDCYTWFNSIAYRASTTSIQKMKGQWPYSFDINLIGAVHNYK